MDKKFASACDQLSSLDCEVNNLINIAHDKTNPYSQYAMLLLKLYQADDMANFVDELRSNRSSKLTKITLSRVFVWLIICGIVIFAVSFNYCYDPYEGVGASLLATILIYLPRECMLLFAIALVCLPVNCYRNKIKRHTLHGICIRALKCLEK